MAVASRTAAGLERQEGSENSKTSGSRFLRELLPNTGDFITGWSPVRTASVTVEDQRAGLERFFEFSVTERKCLVVVVRTDNVKLQSVAHEPSCCFEICRVFALPLSMPYRAVTERPPARAMRPCVRFRAVLSTLDGSASPRRASQHSRFAERSGARYPLPQGWPRSSRTGRLCWAAAHEKRVPLLVNQMPARYRQTESRSRKVPFSPPTRSTNLRFADRLASALAQPDPPISEEHGRLGRVARLSESSCSSCEDDGKFQTFDQSCERAARES